MNLSIKLPPNRLDQQLLRGSGDEYFSSWAAKHLQAENYDETFKKPEWKGEIVEKFLSGAGMEL
jgi:hypothetical protein